MLGSMGQRSLGGGQGSCCILSLMVSEIPNCLHTCTLSPLFLALFSCLHFLSSLFSHFPFFIRGIHPLCPMMQYNIPIQSVTTLHCDYMVTGQ